MKGLIVLGSKRDSSPPSPRRLGFRVVRHLQSSLVKKWPEISLKLIDPLEFETSNEFKPHFSYSKTNLPESLAQLASDVEEARFYVMVSPEYNHSMSPALADLLNHFGSSLFSFKPSLIVTYSAGQWGGTRAAIVMRSFLSELGCLPVSTMLHIPRAHEVFDPEGEIQEGQNRERWEKYFERGFKQLKWWAEAADVYRKKLEPFEISEPFVKDPSERNAPTKD